MPASQAIRPADLLLDDINARIAVPSAGQREAHQAIGRQQDRKLQVLAADILRWGLDPSNLTIVVPLAEDSTRYIVLEGNRRLAALKALENPDSVAGAVTPSVLNHLRRLSRDYQKNPIEEVSCVVFPSREEANHWIELRHTGENGGAGTVSWGSDDVARYRARSGRADPTTQALDFLQDRGDLSVSARGEVPASSLKRLLGTPEVRQKLGLDLRAGELSMLVTDPAKIAKALLHVVRDLSSGRIRTEAIYKKPDRLKYAQSLPATIVVTPTLKPGEGVPMAASAATGAKTSAKRARVAKERDKLIPSDCVMKIGQARIRQIEGELRNLRLSQHKNAIAVLFRVFIELSVDAYIDDNNLTVTKVQGQPWAALGSKLRAALDDLKAKQKLNAQQAAPVARFVQKDSFLAPSVGLMHAWVHNQHSFPAAGDLRTHWDNLQPFMTALWSA